MSDPGDGREFDHAPVMAEEVVRLFVGVPTGVLVDATLGGGGHAALLLDARPDCRLLGLDRDPAALVAAGDRLAGADDRVTLRHARFDHLADVMATLSIPSLSGALFDLGVSSPQLDRAERGFSYRFDGPLDMRMDPSEPGTAADIVNGYPADALARVLREHGDERFASRIAAAIVAARPLRSTLELAEIVRAAIPAAARRTGGHPAKRSFQAIRIEVNRELEILASALRTTIGALAPGGVLAVLSYHSGEDRIVKRVMREAETGGCTCPPGLPCMCGAEPQVRLVRRGGSTPSPVEIAANPRAQSARLRAAFRLRTTVDGDAR